MSNKKTSLSPSPPLPHVWQLFIYLFYKDFMSNNETLMTTTIIYSLQEFVL
jgi:hypothetical protein